MMEYDVFHELPAGFLKTTAATIRQIFPRPALIHLSGLRPRPVFVSILLHGNEDVGLRAVQQLLSRFLGTVLPRGLSIFVGNVAAAAQGLRRLPHQPDYNRVWPGSEEPPGPEQEMMARVVAQMRRRDLFVSIDLHNNTGVNPHYACVCDTSSSHLQLATLFSRTVVYFTQPRGVQTMAFAPICPAITCECGKVGDASGVERAVELLNACLHLADLPDHPVPEGDLHLFHTVATVKVPDDVSIGFGDADAELVFPTDLDRSNFCEIGPGSEIAIRKPGSTGRLVVHDGTGRNCTADYLTEQGSSIRLKKRLLPSMLTLDERVIRQDCLCYFMERYALTDKP
ncbi:M14 family metallopeptidase [Planctomicrobium sp. SH664]|uniref:M14 family metallopeptidase n=1 Tax=Planctomicrobium sp. SH664 TaxID=3448125 RepID=UPI003F5BDA52